MEVVITFPVSWNGDEARISRLDCMVIRFVTEEMRRTVHEEGDVNGQNLTHQVSAQHREVERFAPEVNWNANGNDVAHHQVTHFEVLMLEPRDRIFEDVTVVNTVSLFLVFRMTLSKNPTDMCEEESSKSVMWIAVSVAEFVMRSMEAAPVVN